MRVLHVVESLDKGAVENWLLRMLRRARADGMNLDWTFYCTLGAPGPRHDEALALGARVVVSPVPLKSKLAFMRALRAEAVRGRYDVLHAHHDLVSAIYLVACLGVPIARRIVHAHNPDEGVLTPSRAKQRVFRPLFRRLCFALSDALAANASHTLDTFLAGRPRAAGDRVLYYGVDPAPFVEAGGDRLAFRRSLGVPDTARILLFLGRMTWEKNPLFAVDVLHELRQLDPDVIGVFAGAGSLDEPVRRRARELGLDEAFRHIGWCDDVANVMRCCDWFILPHPEDPMEGFGLVVVEAQLAGLRLLLSNGVSTEPLLPGACVERLSLAHTPKQWAEAAMRLGSMPVPPQPDVLRALAASPMDMAFALDKLLSLHEARRA
jgi:glycosyltransferase involved in cell wall biosynthesis